jgi:hypothetical protein
MKKAFLLMTVLAALVMLSSCVSEEYKRSVLWGDDISTRMPLATPSGKPQVVVCGCKVEDLLEVFTARLASRGEKPITIGSGQVYVKKRAVCPYVAMKYGSLFKDPPDVRTMYLFSNIGNDCVQIDVWVEIPDSWGGVADLSTSKVGHAAQEDLEKFKAEMEIQRRIQ